MRAMFEPGDRVRTLAQRKSGHTRLPGYLQRKPGIVERRIGEFAFADERAAGRPGARREALYTVRFAARDVWGGRATAGDSIAADLFESYLEPDR